MKAPVLQGTSTSTEPKVQVCHLSPMETGGMYARANELPLGHNSGALRLGPWVGFASPTEGSLCFGKVVSSVATWYVGIEDVSG